MSMKKYSANDLSKLAGVSVRTLHHYDDIGLLKPALRSESGYRFYGENELLKLQQILFYKELELPLKEIQVIMSRPDFDLIKALEDHKVALTSKRKRIAVMLQTIDKTISNLKDKKMITNEELYEGFPKEEAERVRNQAIELYGKEAIATSENSLKKLTTEELQQLKDEQKSVFRDLFNLSHMEPDSADVQFQIARHYKNVRKFWGTDGAEDPQKAQYKGLGQLYIDDERFTRIDGKPQPEFGEFLSRAMAHFVKTQL